MWARVAIVYIMEYGYIYSTLIRQVVGAGNSIFYVAIAVLRLCDIMGGKVLAMSAFTYRRGTPSLVMDRKYENDWT
jgi:hypothetical protein